MSESISIRGLTIIIPTFNRSEHLKRLLNYYDKTLNVDFLILDSSDAKVQENNRLFTNGLKGRYQYLQFKPYIEPKQKVMLGLKSVRTKYCAFCADDDLVIPTVLNDAIDFLRKNSDFICVDGGYLSIHRQKNFLKVDIEYSKRGNDLDNSCARVFRLLNNYESLFYGVFRADELKRIISSFGEIKELHYLELFQSVATVLLGKTHRLADFYAMRQVGPAAEPDRKNWQTYYWFAENPGEFLDHYLVYREELWRFYSKNTKDDSVLERSEFLRAMDLSHATFLSKNYPYEYICTEVATLIGENNPSGMQLSETIFNGIDSSKNLDSSCYRNSSVIVRVFRKIWRAINLVFNTTNYHGSGKFIYVFSEKAGWLKNNNKFRNITFELEKYFNS